MKEKTRQIILAKVRPMFPQFSAREIIANTIAGRIRAYAYFSTDPYGDQGYVVEIPLK